MRRGQGEVDQVSDASNMYAFVAFKDEVEIEVPSGMDDMRYVVP
jgi:hypothetical protein